MYSSAISDGPPKPWRSAIAGDEGGRVPSSEDPTARFELIHPLGKYLDHTPPVTVNLWPFHPLVFSPFSHTLPTSDRPWFLRSSLESQGSF